MPIALNSDTNSRVSINDNQEIDLITNSQPRFRIEQTGQIKAVYESQVGTDYNTQLDNGYLCRAWVNFNGTATQKTGTYTISGTTITVSITSHGLTTGNFAQLDFDSGDGVDGRYQVTVINANSYTVTNPVSGSTGGNITQDAMIRASGNVSSITDNNTGDYTINFTTALPDANYSALVNVGAISTGSWGMPTTVLLGAKSTSNFIGLYSTTQMSLIIVRQSAYSDENLITVGIFR